VKPPLSSTSRWCLRGDYPLQVQQRAAHSLRTNDVVIVNFSTDSTTHHTWKGQAHVEDDGIEISYKDERGKRQGRYVFPNPHITVHALHIRKARRSTPLTYTPGTRISVTFSKNRQISTWTGSVVSILPQKRHAIVIYDRLPKQKLLFPPPETADITMMNFKVFPRTSSEITRQRQQQLRYRRTATEVANLLAPLTAGLGDHAVAEQQNNAQPMPPLLPTPTTIITPPRAYPRKGIRVATFNTLTLTDIARLHQLFAFMDIRGVDVIGLQETRLRNSLPETEYAGYKILQEPADERGHHGCALLFGKRCTVLSHETVYQHRAIQATVRIKARGQNATESVLSAYFPQRTSPEQERFTEQLTEYIKNQTSKPIIMCDANGGEDDLCNSIQYTSAAKHAGHEKPTWRKNTLDFVLIPKHRRNMVKSVTYEQPIRSDHRMLTSVLQPVYKANIPPRERSIKLHDLAYDPDKRKEFEENYKSTNSTSLCDLATQVKATPGNYNATRPKQTEYWHNLHQHTEQHLEAHLEEKTRRDMQAFYSLKDDNPWHAWLVIDSTRHHHAQVAGATDAHKLLEHFKPQMEDRPPPEPPPRTHVPHKHLVNINPGDFSLKELQRALRSMKNHTSAGPDGIPTEAYRINRVQKDLLKVLNNALDLDELPKELVLGTLTPVYKRKGNAKDTANYRPIVLLSVALKVLHKMILHRLRDQIDPLLMPHQSAYREGHATTQNMLALQELMERSRTTNLPLLAVFTDFSKAFDSINREHLLHLLEQWNVPERFISFLCKSHEQQRLHVRFDGVETTATISPKVGVMQGDTLAPYLFILVIDQILRQIPYEHGALADAIPGARFKSRIAALAYADDVILLSNTREGAQSLLTHFENYALRWGLHLNTKPGKTETMLVAHNSLRGQINAALSSQKGPVGVTTKYKYLGYNIDALQKANWKHDLKTRMPLAWNAVHTHERLWSPQIPTSARKHMFQTLVLPRITYAAMCYPMTPPALFHLHVQATKLLRYVLNAPTHSRDNPHIHTEDLYDIIPFAPAVLAKQLVQQWGHWIRHDTAQNHPVTLALLGELPHVRNKRGRRYAPSDSLKDLTLLTPLELLEFPHDRTRWRRLAWTAALTVADEIARRVNSRRYDDGTPLPDWNPIFTKWKGKVCH
jgi:exonuclease III